MNRFTKNFVSLIYLLVTNLALFAQTNPTPQALPYAQSFSTLTGSTTTFPAGIQGWGFGSTALSTTFTTIAPTADQALSGSTNTSTSAFVGDMNGKMGLLSTATNMKAIGLAISTSSLNNINVSFIAATQAQINGGRIDEIGVQYRIGTSGGFTNITGSTYQNNATSTNTTGTVTTSINSATVTFVLPAACENQSIVQLRWIMRDVSAGGGGNRPSFSIDNISISGSSIVSSNADLSALSIIPGSINETFSPSVLNYTANEANTVSSITITPTKSDVNATVVINPASPVTLNTPTTNITVSVTAQDGTTTKIYNLVVTKAAAPVPTLSLTSPLTSFGNVCINTTAGPNSFTLSGINLDASNINIAALPGFSFSENNGGPFTSTLSFAYGGGTSFSGKQIYVLFNPTTVQAYDGNIILSGGGLSTNFNVAATGSGVNTLASVTTVAATNIMATSATANGTINTTGCSSITAYGIEYSLSSGFADGTGMPLPASNLSGSNFSVNLSSLIPNTRYYYKAYTTTSAGTNYGTQQAFNCSPLPVVMALQSGLSYTETFSDIVNWSSFFITGNGANHWTGLSSTATSPASGIPNPTIFTVATNTFQTAITPGTNITFGGVQKGTDQIGAFQNQSIVLLSTGSTSGSLTNNFSAAALDFYLDFTGINAGTLSFDWASVNNDVGDRNGSLRIYTSVDGISFTELTQADVLNFTNNSPTSGSKSNIALPAIFNNNANARIRFYYHNGTGGTTGSRPKISIDNLNVTAVATTPCATPTDPATALNFSSITDVSLIGSFTGVASADNYLIIMSSNSSLTSNPVNSLVYNIGDNVGDGTVISKGGTTSFSATGLNPLTTYYFFIFPLNAACTGGPLYNTTNVLLGNVTTTAGLPNCTAPTSQPTTLTFGTVGVNSIQGSFTSSTANEYLVLRSTDATLTNNPVDAHVYNIGDILGNAIVVERNNAATFTANGLTPNTTYNFFIFSLNSQNCLNGPVYNTVAPLSGTQSTQPLPPCSNPTNQPTNLALTASNTNISGTFTGVADADNYLVVISQSPTLTATPVDATDYAVGTSLGGGTVIANTNVTSFLAQNLTKNNLYYFFVFAENKNCNGGTKYANASPLTANITTTNIADNNYYFGTLHSHSDYSDGNQDNQNLGYTPTTDYTYAMTSQCLDFLGISEHNHFSSANSPGNSITNYHQGSIEANNFTASNPNFLALYGMEWGTIGPPGGHVVIYGDGMDNLYGWESGSGGWGSSNNYDVYVAKNDYTGANGLFKTINDNIAKNTFATLAHPNLSDFNNIATLPYNAIADNAIVGSAVESGPAFSTNTNYTNPSTMSYLWYYQTLLSKGYHLGATIDHDNHNTTFGHTTRARTAVVSPTLSKSDIIKAMRNMQFYATEDCDSKVDFSINTKMIGSTFTDRFAPNIAATLIDGAINTPITIPIIRVMFGVPGSGVLPVKIDSVIGTFLNFTDINLANNSTGYYYLDITTTSGASIITSPIWYTRSDNNVVLAVKLSAFNVEKINNNAAKISWSTEQEINSNNFSIERSADGRTWKSIAIVNAKGNSTSHVDYSMFDNAPLKGINYYRIKQIDLDRNFIYSTVKSVLFNTSYLVEIAPNPATDFVHIYFERNNNQSSTIQLLNAEGKIVYSTSSVQQHVQINTANFAKGLYFVKILNTDEVTTLKVLIQ